MRVTGIVNWYVGMNSTGENEQMDECHVEEREVDSLIMRSHAESRASAMMLYH